MNICGVQVHYVCQNMSSDLFSTIRIGMNKIQGVNIIAEIVMHKTITSKTQILKFRVKPSASE